MFQMRSGSLIHLHFECIWPGQSEQIETQEKLLKMLRFATLVKHNVFIIGLLPDINIGEE